MKYPYSMIIQWSGEDDAYVVTLPDFPLAQTHGATYREAVENAQDVLDLLVQTYTLEGRRLPEPAPLMAA